MKRRLISICLLLTVLFIAGCSGGPDANQTDTQNQTEFSSSQASADTLTPTDTSTDAGIATNTGVTSDPYVDPVDMSLLWEKLLQKTEHFEMYGSDKSRAYHCTVVADSGILLEDTYGDNWYRVSFSEEGSIGCLSIIGGGPTCRYRFYDFANERVSRIYENPFTRSGNLVATIDHRGDEVVLVVQDIFDRSVYYAEFREDWVVPYLVIQNVQMEFIENNTKLKVPYLEDGTYQNKVVILDLP